VVGRRVAAYSQFIGRPLWKALFAEMRHRSAVSEIDPAKYEARVFLKLAFFAVCLAAPRELHANETAIFIFCFMNKLFEIVYH
jgi:hypothetical protein